MAYTPKNYSLLPISGSTVGSAPPSTAIMGGVLAAGTSLPTPQSIPSGKLIGALGDKFGRLVTLNNGPRDMVGELNGSNSTNITSINTFSAVTPVPGASNYYDITNITIQNNSSSSTGAILSDAPTLGSSSPTTYTYSTAQTFNWTAPTGVTSVTVSAWGGGGGGGGGGSRIIQPVLNGAGARGYDGQITLVYSNVSNSYYFQIPANSTRGVNYTIPLKSTQANTAWYMESLTSTSLYVSVSYILNKG